MGFFNSLKENFNHGGLDIKLQSPGSAEMTDTSIPVTVTLTAKEPRLVNTVTLEIAAVYKAPNEHSTPYMAPESLYKATLATGLQMAGGETKQFPVNLPVVTKADEVKTGGLVGSLTNNFNQQNYDYYITAKADVYGIKLDPSSQNQIIFNGYGLKGKVFHNTN